MIDWEFGASSSGEPLPSDADRVDLLRAAIASTPEAEEAWTAWISRHDLARIDASSFALLPAVYVRQRRGDALGAAEGKLAGIHRWSWVRNQMALRCASTALAQLAAAGIAAIALKGLALLLSAYDDLGARVMFDVDLLVSENEALEAAGLLVANGWTPQRPLPPRALLPYVCSVTLVDGRGGTLDLHWKPLPLDGPAGAWEGIRARAVERAAGGVTARVPAPEDLALLTILHARRPDPQAGLRWALDLATIDRSRAVDWDVVRERATAWGVSGTVRRALEWAGGAPAAVPADAFQGVWPQETTDDVRRQRFLRTFGDINRGRIVMLAEHRWLHADVNARRGRFPERLSFRRYLFEYCRNCWGTRGLTDTLARAVRRAAVGRWTTHGAMTRHAGE